MNQLKAYILGFLFAGFVFPQQSHAAEVRPLSTQIQEVVKWLTGKFDNTNQVASNASVPLISMSNCQVQLDGGNGTDGSQNVYLE